MTQAQAPSGLDTDGYGRGLSTEQLAFQRLYGPWHGFDPPEAAAVFEDVGIPWWVAGGWAIEAFTGQRREHEDIDIAILRRHLPVLRSSLAGRFHVWAAGPDGLTPLDDRQMSMPDQADQVWLRAHALAPWRADVLLNPDAEGRWVFRRDPSYDVPIDQATWWHHGVRYLKPEIVLAFKAKHSRPKDEADFDTAAPRLDPAARAWLAEFLERFHPDHAWRERL